MQRRNFFKGLLASVLPFLLPRWTRVQAHQAAVQPVTMHELARAVLPESLGPKRIQEVADQFENWIRNYKPTAEMSCGYGFTREEATPPSPAVHYVDQLRQLATAAVAEGSPFAKLDGAMQRDLVGRALAAAGLERIPSRPDGKHVAADLLACFYSSSDGEDFLYNAAIERAACRGLQSSPERPAPLKDAV